MLYWAGVLVLFASALACAASGEHSFDASTVEGHPWPWLDRELPEIGMLCKAAADERHYGRILACERMERLFLGIDIGKHSDRLGFGNTWDENWKRAVETMRATVDIWHISEEARTDKDILSEYLADFFKPNGGILWRRGLIEATRQYDLTMRVLQQLDIMKASESAGDNT